MIEDLIKFSKNERLNKKTNMLFFFFLVLAFMLNISLVLRLFHKCESA